ncbi:MAG: NUDIX domain-containing protein [Candidatus Daviesbacteria bacterium]|nr:NUDIX domain-containing protein [Candidatus Daviesbacteria bacterium]
MNEPDELFVQVDKHNNVIGPITKRVSHQKGILHRTVAILVFNKSGQLLMQLRPKTRDLYPGLYTLSATGHVDWTSNGAEDYEAAAEREYEEELGKKPTNPLEFQLTTEIDTPTHHVMPYVYHTVDEGPFHTNPKEVEKVEFLSLEEIKKLAENGQITPPSIITLEKLKLI